MTTAAVRPDAPAPTPAAAVPGVRPARAEEAPTLAQVLAVAFHDDALTRWAFPDDTYRARILPAFFRVFVDQCLAHQGVLTTDAVDAALLFLPPGVWEQPSHLADDADHAARALDAAIDAAAHPESARRLAAITHLQARRHPRHRPHYYLAFLGVHPDARHSGAGAALLAAVMAEIDASGQAAYTEASSRGGAHLADIGGFTRFGEAIALPGGGPRLHPMWRGPR
ncbi:hypothetical protein [Kitasatospora sp. NPDC097643]|uniref:hypothetical protein n=1 Tax=Kitasatospora sp. NPDC097643 TaxID=3157230 RepID=UPI00331D7F21